MECTFCPGNQATCHLSKLVNAKSIDVHVCEKCIPQLGQKDLVDFDIWGAVSKLAAIKGKEDPAAAVENEIKEISAKSLLIPSPTPAASNKCSSCGFTSEDVRKTGRLGCGECYGVFASLLQDVLNDCQKGTRHAGKMPKSLRKPNKKRLQEDLSTAVGKEQFEEAARIRDELGKIGEEG
jgi:protein arginine kinase activator